MLLISLWKEEKMLSLLQNNKNKLFLTLILSCVLVGGLTSCEFNLGINQSTVSLSGDFSDIKNHWKTELKSHMNNVRQMKLKTNNTPSTKENALLLLWNKRDIDKDEESIYSHIYFKFQKENIPTEGEIFAQVIEDFKNETINIVNALISNSPQKIVEYVENI